MIRIILHKYYSYIEGVCEMSVFLVSREEEFVSLHCLILVFGPNTSIQMSRLGIFLIIANDHQSSSHTSLSS